MNSNLRILHLEDDRYDAELIRHILQAEELVRELVRVETGREFSEALGQGPFDLILSDYTLPGFNGMAALNMAREKQPAAPFLFVSGTIDEELAVESLKQGATDYVFKNRLSRLGPSVRRALRGVAEREENRRAEESMRQSEHKYRQVFESLSDAAFLFDLATGRVLDANKQGELLLGRTRAEIIGLNQTQFHAPAKLEAYRAAVSTLATQKTAVDFESEIIRLDGRVVPVTIRGTALELYGRELILGLYNDLTAHRQTQDQIYEQATLLDLVPDAILVRDLAGRIRYWNEGAVRLYGWTRAEALGQPVAELLDHECAELAAANRLILEHGEWHGELHQVNRDHHELRVHSRWSLMRNEQGQPKSVLLVNTDATEQPSNRLKCGQAERSTVMTR